ncbi:MAG: hypothetical protein ACLUPK_02545 [Veillonella sp.]
MMKLTADHGNAELYGLTMKPARIHTAHTTNLAPLILIGDDTSK